MSSDKKVVVIGAEISGLTSAYLPDKENFDVTIPEQRGNSQMIRLKKSGKSKLLFFSYLR